MYLEWTICDTSSAKMMFFPRDFGISVTNMLYIIGERIAPCGTYALISKGGVCTVPTQTDAVLSSKKLENILRIHGGNPVRASFSPVCQTLSKADFTSRTTILTWYRLAIFCAMVS